MRITHSKSSQQAKSYYQTSDYYESGPDQLKGRWFGKGAAVLGLSGDVDRLAFERLIDNQHPTTGERLTPRNHAARRCGTDITLSASKSVSILWAATGDDRILEAVQNAAHDTFTELEKDAQSRLNIKRGTMELIKTGSIVGASWLHCTARPIDGYADPQLHVHGFVVNATQTKEGRWTALDLSAVVRDSGYYESIFQSSLSSHIEALGYPVDRSRHNFEVAGIERDTITKFSRRTGLIEQLASDWGVTNADDKGRLGQRTREKKQSLIPEADLPAHWQSLLTRQEQQSILDIQAGKVKPKFAKVTADQAVDYAVKHHFRAGSGRPRASIAAHRESVWHRLGNAPTNCGCDEPT